MQRPGSVPQRREAVVGSSCPVCESDESVPVVSFELPVDTNRLWTTEQGAREAARGTIDLQYCAACGHLYNAAYDDALVDYENAYENSQMFSPRFRAYAEELADHLVRAYALRGGTVLEIGGGRGEFLGILCERARCRGISFGPSYRPAPDDVLPPGVRFITDYYREAYADTPADLVVCRHVLEHFGDPHDLIATVRKTIASRDIAVYFEVPNGEYMLARPAIHEPIFTHPSYYTRASLERLFVAHGFCLTRFWEGFDGQFLALEARPGGMAMPAPPTVGEERAARFGRAVASARHRWDAEFARLAGRRVVVWGAGAKAVNFLNAFLPQPSAVSYVVDVNPRKAGTYVAGTGHRIVPPQYAIDHPPDAVVVMNPAYRAEIESALRPLGRTVEMLFA